MRRPTDVEETDRPSQAAEAVVSTGGVSSLGSFVERLNEEIAEINSKLH